MAVPVFRPTVKRKDMGSVLSCIVSDKIGPGEISRDLASRACHLLGHSGGVSLANSYLAISVALEALGLAASDAVIVSALAPALWLRVIQDKGLVPLVADVEADTASIDPAQAASLVQKGAKAILVPHTLGIAADIEALKVHGLPILEDASQALGGKVGEAAVRRRRRHLPSVPRPRKHHHLRRRGARAGPLPPDGVGPEADPGKLAAVFSACRHERGAGHRAACSPGELRCGTPRSCRSLCAGALEVPPHVAGPESRSGECAAPLSP